jgi:hypothetical protein
MITNEAEALARYKHVEKEADSLGRIIGVRRLRPSEQTKLVGMTQDLSGFDMTIATDAEGEKEEFAVPHRGPLLITAAVCEINDVKIPFPKNRAELDAIYDRLDVPGLRAAVTAMTRLSAADAEIDVVQSAKN